MRIQHNILAMNAYRNYNANTSALAKNLEKLSSGYRINRAGDDAAGLAISEKMRAQITGLNAAQKNVKDGISLVKTAEGAMQEVQDMLNRMEYLATQSANGTYQNEVDRENLQKEVNALRTEIDRIADSSNFNGIKLLDGKLGMNRDAFTMEAADAEAAVSGAISLTGKLSAKGTASPELHLEEASATQTAPAFTIDLGDLSVDASALTAAGQFKINVLGQDCAISVVQNGNAGSSTYDATKLATDLKTALSTTFGTAKNVGATPVKWEGAIGGTGGLRIGDLGFTVANNAGTITFTYAGRYEGTGAVGAKTTWKAGAKFTEDEATYVNEVVGMGVSVSDKAGATQTGDVVHDNTNVTYAVAEKIAGRAGINLTLDASLIANGNTLTIDGQDFIFKTDANDTSLTGANVIDVSGYAAADQVHAAVDLLSQQTKFSGADDREWKIASAGNDKIHIEQVTASASGKELKTYEDLTSKISVAGADTPAKAAGTKITIDTSADGLKEGDKLTIGEKTYVFTKDPTSVTGDNLVGVDISTPANVAANLNTALGNNGMTSEVSGTNAVIVRAAAEGKGIPQVSGSGLTLQIGESSDSFNQLGLRIGDMHVTAMGTMDDAGVVTSIDDIDISNQKGAQDAVAVIKDAINYVSSIRGDLGATQNRLEHTANNLSVMAENIQDAESTIRDTDVAEEMMAYTKNNILVQAAQAMLAQANAVPQGVLQLLQ